MSALQGTVLLPGASVQVYDRTGQLLFQVLTGADGRFTFELPREGTYRLKASLGGFASREVELGVGRETPRHGPLQVQIDLALADVEERVEVRQESAVVSLGVSIASASVVAAASVDAAVAAGRSLEGMLLLLPGVLRGPDGVNIKGGRATQSAQQLGVFNFTDPAFGFPFRVPVTAVASIEVLPNPYAVEFGRFSSGVSVIETRRAGDAWQFSILGLEPTFRVRRGSIVRIRGIEWFGPRGMAGGPLRRGKAWFTLTGQYRYGVTEVMSRPDTDLMHRQDFAAMARLDLRLSRDFSVTATALVSPEKRDNVGLDTFTGPEATYDIRQSLTSGTFSLRHILTDTLVLDTAVQASWHTARSGPSHPDVMVIRPTAVEGAHFDTQWRRMQGVQWVSTLSGYRRNRSGEHLFKAGVDLMSAALDGTVAATPVEIRRYSGLLAERIVFDSGARQHTRATDVAAYVQDRWRVAPTVVLESGMRVDRDSVLSHTNLTPRLGVAVSRTPGGGLVLRGGIGTFFEHTPLVVGDFEHLDTRTITRFDEDGRTPLGPEIRLVARRAPGLHTPYALTLETSAEWRAKPSLTIRGHYLTRLGRHELLVEPQEEVGELLLDDSGRSRYWEIAVGSQWRHGDRAQTSISYVRSDARSDYNALASYVGPGRAAIVRPNAYGQSGGDVPHRLVATARWQIGENWRTSGALEVRSGLPFSAVNERQQFVGLRNGAGRFPVVVNLDVFVERRLRIFGLRPWIGVSVNNMLNRHTPLDVQRNVDAPTYGFFTNGVPRRVRLALRVTR